MKEKYELTLLKYYIKISIPFTKFKFKIPCGYSLDTTDMIDKGTLVDSLLAEGFTNGQKFDLIVKDIE